MTLQNPWLALPDSAPFVLPQDAAYIDAFNQWRHDRCRGRCGHAGCESDASACRDAYRIRLDYTPEPRRGPVDSPVVILQLNASFSDDSREHIPDQLASLRDENHRHLGIAGGGKWWSRCLGAVAREVRRRCFLDRLVCSIELFPYRSQSFAHGSIRLPSQAYTFGLVHRAIARRAVLVITRSEGLWYAAIPELRDAKAAGRLFVLSNPRSTSLSAQTLGETGFNKVLGALCP